MTSVNSPACLLARNHFYRNFPPSTETMTPEFSCQNNSVRHKRKPANFWVTMETSTGIPGGLGSKGLWVNIVLGSSSFHPPTSKPTSPADRDVK